MRVKSHSIVLLAAIILLAACDSTAPATPSPSAPNRAAEVGTITLPAPLQSEVAMPQPVQTGGMQALVTPMPSIEIPPAPTDSIATKIANPNGRYMQYGKLSVALRDAVRNQPSDITFIVDLKDQAFNNNFYGTPWPHPGDPLYDKLVATADRTQPLVEADLKALQAAGEVSEYHPFLLYNSFYVRGTTNALAILSSNAEVGTPYADEPSMFSTAPIYIGIPEYNREVATLGNEKIAPELAQALTANPPSVGFMLYMTTQQGVNNASYDDAYKAQASLDNTLREMKATGKIATYNRFIIYNGFYIEAAPAIVNELAARPDVAHLLLNLNRYVAPPILPAIPTPTHDPNTAPQIPLELAKQMNANPNRVDFLFNSAAQYGLDMGDIPSLHKGEQGEHWLNKESEFIDQHYPPIRAVLAALKQSGDVNSYEEASRSAGFHVIGSARAVNVLAARQDTGRFYYNARISMSDPYMRGTPLPTTTPTPTIPKLAPDLSKVMAANPGSIGFVVYSQPPGPNQSAVQAALEQMQGTGLVSEYHAYGDTFRVRGSAEAVTTLTARGDVIVLLLDASYYLNP